MMMVITGGQLGALLGKRGVVGRGKGGKGGDAWGAVRSIPREEREGEREVMLGGQLGALLGEERWACD